jgi:transketolase
METDRASESTFDAAASRQRCLKYRRRILAISQTMAALHVAPAFSCLELVDCIYFGLMRRAADGKSQDTFLLSKGHGSLAQYVVLEELGVIDQAELDALCTPAGRLGAHPDYGIPGIEAATGSLGHGLPIALGMAIADKIAAVDRTIYVVLSDGELQEGSIWESILLAPSLGLTNLVACLDLNDYQSLGQISQILPNFYPLREKVEAFGWEVLEADGHDEQAIFQAVTARAGTTPTMLIARTVKGKGVSFMQNVPIWHYRSPSPQEYQQALAELAEAEG